jgi:lipoate-protein ligase A
MKLLDLSFTTPQENLACDEALLDWSEEESGVAVLRFWESPRHFVTLGYTDAASREADLEACRVLDIPILRRCSGGGTVLQGPGCLNYALIVLDSTRRAAVQSQRHQQLHHATSPGCVEQTSGCARDQRRLY